MPLVGTSRPSKPPPCLCARPPFFMPPMCGLPSSALASFTSRLILAAIQDFASPPLLRGLRSARAAPQDPSASMPTLPPRLNWRRDTGRSPVLAPVFIISGGVQEDESTLVLGSPAEPRRFALASRAALMDFALVSLIALSPRRAGVPAVAFERCRPRQP